MSKRGSPSLAIKYYEQEEVLLDLFYSRNTWATYATRQVDSAGLKRSEAARPLGSVGSTV